MNNPYTGKTHHEIGTPYYLYDKHSPHSIASSRVMPSAFSPLVLPLSCSFIRNLALEDESAF